MAVRNQIGLFDLVLSQHTTVMPRAAGTLRNKTIELALEWCDGNWCPEGYERVVVCLKVEPSK